MSLTRTEKIPSRFTMGLPLPSDKKEGEIAGYHCWAEFFVDGRGWIPVDISEASKAAAKSPEMVDYYFGGLTPDRIELSHGRDVSLTPRQAGGPLNFFIYPYCEVDGKEAAKETVTRKMSFKDV
jgi:transglutaminase-like putative cysteine protease